MKLCPTCNRTYADDGFTFCLSDGALLSAPYDPAKEKPVSTLQSSGPPPTAVLPSGTDSKPRPDAILPPTIAGPVGTAQSLPLQPHRLPEFASPVLKKRSKVPYLVLVLAVSVVVGGVYLLWSRSLDCPKLKVRCVPAGDEAYCYLDLADQARSGDDGGLRSMAIASLNPVLGFQAASLPGNDSSVSWTSSAGSIISRTSQATVHTKGLAGTSVTVSAVVTSTKWGCSQTVTTSFVVPGNAAAPQMR